MPQLLHVNGLRRSQVAEEFSHCPLDVNPGVAKVQDWTNTRPVSRNLLRSQVDRALHMLVLRTSLANAYHQAWNRGGFGPLKSKLLCALHDVRLIGDNQHTIVLNTSNRSQLRIRISWPEWTRTEEREGREGERERGERERGDSEERERGERGERERDEKKRKRGQLEKRQREVRDKERR